MLTFKVPAATPPLLLKLFNAHWIDSKPPLTSCKKRSPSSVSVNLRVLRWNSRTPTNDSSLVTFFPTAAELIPNLRPAAEKLPLSALLTKHSRWPSMIFLRRFQTNGLS
ncbi:hypothetical protein D3C78_1211270 [compost metagenome]